MYCAVVINKPWLICSALDCTCPGTGEGVSGKPTAETWNWNFVLMDEMLGQRHCTTPLSSWPQSLRTHQGRVQQCVTKKRRSQGQQHQHQHHEEGETERTSFWTWLEKTWDCRGEESTGENGQAVFSSWKNDWEICIFFKGGWNAHFHSISC